MSIAQLIETLEKFDSAYAELMEKKNIVQDEWASNPYVHAQGEELSFEYSDTSEQFITNVSIPETMPEIHNLINEATGMADRIMITSQGHPDGDAMLELRRLSKGKFRIVKGESDSFGWLSAVIITKHARLVY